MTNLEKFKRGITADNLCDTIYCLACPFFQKDAPSTKLCTERLKEWAKEEYKGGRK